jgi:hypothetical protein
MTDVIDGGLTFSGYLQPPDVPADPTGDAWRGLQGATGATGAQGPVGDASLTSVLATGGTTARSAADHVADGLYAQDFGVTADVKCFDCGGFYGWRRHDPSARRHNRQQRNRPEVPRSSGRRRAVCHPHQSHRLPGRCAGAAVAAYRLRPDRYGVSARLGAGGRHGAFAMLIPAVPRC